MLPFLVKEVSSTYTNYYLNQEKKKVLAVIGKNGIDYYLQGDNSFGSYTILKEDYISLSPTENAKMRDTIETSRRIVENDTLNYRVLIHEINYQNRHYILEIGKTTSTIREYNNLLQRFTLYVLIGLIILSILVHLVYTNILLRPLSKIVRTKLINSKFPFREKFSPIKTSTTDFKILDDSLITLMEKIHEAFDKEREFTSNASHELMTPISILQSHIENLMMDETLTEELQNKVSSIMKTLNRLKRIVHSLLYISRIENDQFVKIDTINIRELSSGVMEELGYRLESKSIIFKNHISDTIKVKQVNHDLFFQLLYNLINNAIRYNKENGSIYLYDRFEPDGTSILLIKDTGIGIKHEELGTIFERFKKANKSKSEGFGLGLSIVKSITTFLGFEINIESEFGKGTIVSVTIPAKLVEKRGTELRLNR
jgi:signal transduction histidine kinase